MRICFICVEIFAWGKYGGYGRSTRMIGRELVKLGHDVTAVVPRREDQKPVEDLDGITVLGFEKHRPLSAIEIYRQANADIYHSQEPSFGTFLAQYAMPDRKHLITFRDTRNVKDWWIEFMYPSKNKLQVISNILYEDNYLVAKAVRNANRLFAASKMLIPKARKKYNLTKGISFLPSPVPFLRDVKKSNTPLVCFLGRLDRRKNPRKFFDLAKSFPHVQFMAIGSGQNTNWQNRLQKKYGVLKNLEFVGFIDQFQGREVAELLSKSWILINTSMREGLPTAFIEAVGHKCAILSALDPDGFASKFGCFVKDGNYEKGLNFLLENNNWRRKGMLGFEYVKQEFSVKNSMKKHISIYEESMD